MTLLESLTLYAIDLSTVASELYCTSTTLDTTVGDSDLKSTTLASTVTSMLNSIHVPNDIVILRNTTTIVETMSDEELAQACELIEGKEITFDIEHEKDKVLTKSSKQQ